MKKNLIFLVLAIVFTIAACTKNDTSSSGGTTPGGGNINKESPDFVTFDKGFPEGWRTYTWEIVDNLGYDDRYSIKSANYPVSLLFATKTMESPAYVQFFTLGETIDLYIDGEKMKALSSTSEGNWVKNVYDFDKGTHEFKWEANGAFKYLDAITFALSELATVTTKENIYISGLSVLVGGDVTNNGNGTILSRGVCWSASKNPTINDSIKESGAGTGDFNTWLKLDPNTTYFIRAYAINRVGIAYGKQVSIRL